MFLPNVGLQDLTPWVSRTVQTGCILFGWLSGFPSLDT